MKEIPIKVRLRPKGTAVHPESEGTWCLAGSHGISDDAWKWGKGRVLNAVLQLYEDGSLATRCYGCVKVTDSGLLHGSEWFLDQLEIEEEIIVELDSGL